MTQASGTGRGAGSISVITATFNAGGRIAALIESLCQQTDTDFEWVVVDAQSKDNTLDLVAQRGQGLRCVVVCEPDFGIYDALNKGVKAAGGEYYLVIGADDVLEPQAIANYRAALRAGDGQADIVTARVRCATGIIAPRPGKAWLYGQQGYVSSHAVGSLIRRSLHERFGHYSRRFPIAADQYFIKTAVGGGAVVQVADFIAGEYANDGTSSTDVAGALSEIFRVQLLTEKGRLLQVLLYLARLLKNYRRL